MREGLYEGAEPEDPGVKADDLLLPGAVDDTLPLLRDLLASGLARSPGELDPHLAPQPCQEFRHSLVTDKPGVEQTPEYLGCLLPDRDVRVRQEICGEGDHPGAQLVVGHEADEVCEDNSLQELEDRQLGLIAGGGDAPLEHVEAWGQGVCREDADREVGQGLETGLRHTLVRLGPDELTHVGQQLVEDWVHRGRRESGDEIQRYNRKIFPEIESYLIL